MSTVKELAKDDQPRERALRYGIESLSVPDLWALILRTGLVGKPITELCRDFMRANGDSLFSLERKSLKEIMKVPGIGPTKGLQISAVMELIRRYNREKIGERYVIRDAKSIYELMRSDIGNLPHEEIHAIYVNNRNEVLSRKRISSGSSTATVFDAKKILKEALLIDATGIVLCHNHPSGALLTSPQDDQITRRLAEACRTMDLRMIDHLVVTSAGFYSYFDSGRL